MKKQFLTIFAAIAFLIIGTVTTVFAQSGKAAKVNVKFDFHVGEKIYPAGEYLIESINRTSDNVLQIRSTEKGKIQLITANIFNAAKNQQPKLVFRRQGKNYFLSRIFLDNSQWGFSLRPSHKQKEGLASAKVDTIEVAVLK